MTTLRVLDFETTGFEPPEAVVIEVGYSDYNVETKGISDPISFLCSADVIPPENRAVHHIRLADLEGAPEYDSESLVDSFKEDGVAAIVAHNMNFEQQWLGEPGLPLVCTYKAALRVWPDAPSHSNGALRYWLEDQGLLSLEYEVAMPPHRAGPDAYVTAHILKALFATGLTGKEMVAWTKEPKLMPRINFGKHKGSSWPDAPQSYLNWILGSDMDDDTKWNAKREIERRNGESK